MGIAAGPLSDNRLQVFTDRGGQVWTTWQPDPAPDSGWLPWSTLDAAEGLQCCAAVQLPNAVLALFGLDFKQPGASYAMKVSSDVNADWAGLFSVYGSLGSPLAVAVAQNVIKAGVQAFVWDSVSFGGSQLLTNFRQSSDVHAGFTPGQLFDPMPEWGRIPQPKITGAGLLQAAPLSNNGIQLWLNPAEGGLGEPWWTTWTPGGADMEWVPWAAFQPVPEPATGWQLAVGQLPDKRLQLWAFSLATGMIYSCWKATATPNASWTPWLPFLDPFASSVQSFVAAPLSDGRLQLWAVDGGNAIWSAWKLTTDPDSNWAPWSPFAGPP